MVQTVFIGLAAGLAAALLFASVASGSLLSILLFYLAPLPVMIAALGWSHIAALIAAAAAAAGLAALFGGWFFVAFLISVGLPAWWLGYLTLLGRPATDGGMEWYPIGRIVVWGAVLGTLVVVSAIPHFGADAESFQSGLRHAFEGLLQLGSRTSDGTLVELGISDPDSLLDFLVIVVPPTAAVLSTFTNLGNLWLAGRIVKMSGRLKRPWPPLPTMTFPRLTPALLGAAIAGTFLPGLLGIVSSVLTAGLLMAYAILGFAVVHAVTSGFNGRGFVLVGIYAIAAVFGWPMLLMAFVGVLDAAVDIRGRVASKRASPKPRS